MEILEQLIPTIIYMLNKSLNLELSEEEIIDIDNYTYKKFNNLYGKYIDYLKINDAEAYEKLEACIREAIIKNKNKFKKDVTVKTKYPKTFITPTDKVSGLLTNGELVPNELTEIAIEKKGSKKKITSYVNINYDNLLNGEVQIRGKKEFTPYDRQVHDAIVTLYIEGQNEYMTPKMICQVLTGDKNQRFTKKQLEDITESITKCNNITISINADEEAKAYNKDIDKFNVQGRLIEFQKINACLNGTDVECFKILTTPLLFSYANMKNQIGRIDMKYLKSPINKTPETLALQGYLQRRIIAMKSSSTISKNVLYDTVYKYLDITASSDSALRNKKSKIRNQTKTILNYWKQEKFIKDYTENKKGNDIYSITITI